MVKHGNTWVMSQTSLTCRIHQYKLLNVENQPEIKAEKDAKEQKLQTKTMSFKKGFEL